VVKLFYKFVRWLKGKAGRCCGPDVKKCCSGKESGEE